MGPVAWSYYVIPKRLVSYSSVMDLIYFKSNQKYLTSKISCKPSTSLYTLYHVYKPTWGKCCQATKPARNSSQISLKSLLNFLKRKQKDIFHNVALCKLCLIQRWDGQICNNFDCRAKLGLKKNVGHSCLGHKIPEDSMAMAGMLR